MSTEEIRQEAEKHILPEYEVKDLPSKFIGYPAGTRVYVKPFSFGEQINLQKIGRNGVELMRNILNSVKVEGMPKNLLTPQDVVFLGIYRKLVSTKHDKITAQSFCPHCAKQNEHHFTLRDLKFKTPEFEIMPIQAELEHYTIEFGLLSTKAFLECLDKYKGEPLAMLAMQVKRVYENKYNADTNKNELIEVDLGSEDRRIERIRQILGRCVDEDKEILDEVAGILQGYGLRPLDVKCNDEFCQQDYSIELDDKSVLVFPFREHKEFDRSRIKLRAK